MGFATVAGASLMCTFGATPATLNPTPSKVRVGGKPAANVQDSAFPLNVPSFGMCRSPSNPQVQALMPVPPPGTIKPVPCMPVLTGAPWVGSGAVKVKLGGQEALTNQGCLTCQWAGQIKITNPGQMKVKL